MNDFGVGSRFTWFFVFVRRGFTLATSGVQGLIIFSLAENTFVETKGRRQDEIRAKRAVCRRESNPFSIDNLWMTERVEDSTFRTTCRSVAACIRSKTCARSWTALPWSGSRFVTLASAPALLLSTRIQWRWVFEIRKCLCFTFDFQGPTVEYVAVLSGTMWFY